MGCYDLSSVQPQTPWKVEQALELQIHRIIYLEGTSGGHLQNPTQSRGMFSQEVV